MVRSVLRHRRPPISTVWRAAVRGCMAASGALPSRVLSHACTALESRLQCGRERVLAHAALASGRSRLAHLQVPGLPCSVKYSAQTREGAPLSLSAHANAHTSASTRTHTHAHARTHTHAHACTHTHAHACTRTHARKHTHAHACTKASAHSCTRTRTHAHACTKASAHSCTRTRTPKCTHASARNRIPRA